MMNRRFDAIGQTFTVTATHQERVLDDTAWRSVTRMSWDRYRGADYRVDCVVHDDPNVPPSVVIVAEHERDWLVLEVE